MNYSNHILDYSKYNYICLPKAGSPPPFRWLVVHDKKFYVLEDIETWIVFKKPIFSRTRRQTLRHKQKYRPAPGKVISCHPKVSGDRITWGIFSYTWWCPIEDKTLEVWKCKIPKGTLVYANSWEYTSEELEFICCVREEKDNSTVYHVPKEA